jgi:hypothetical protein
MLLAVLAVPAPAHAQPSAAADICTSDSGIDYPCDAETDLGQS